ncbi:MAG: DinB family protein [Acidimicrobiales bacterium]
MADERCEECGFDSSQLSPSDAAVALRSFGRRYRTPLSRFLVGEDGDRLLRWRPPGDGSSALEYACHVRDALAFLGQALAQTLVADDPSFAGIRSPGQGSSDPNCNEGNPAEVADQLATNAERIADQVDGVPAEDWVRPAEMAGESTTAIGLVRKAVHEGSHHLLDIGRVLRAARQAS